MGTPTAAILCPRIQVLAIVASVPFDGLLLRAGVAVLAVVLAVALAAVGLVVIAARVGLSVRELHQVGLGRQAGLTNPLVVELHRAFERGEIVAHFQPQVDLRTGRVVGAEALARWNHPDRGTLPPGDWMPLVVASGLMPDLTRAMLDQTAQAFTCCAEHGHRVQLSVNVSAVNLTEPFLAAAVSQLISSPPVGPGRLVLEITEDAVVTDRPAAREVLAGLRRLGALVSVDDYGTGQASLSYLRDLPLDELKLDRSFVQGAPYCPRNAALVRSTVDLAHDLGLSLVAEGIEDAETEAWLREAGCDVGQGYLHARPMPLDQLMAWLDADAAARQTTPVLDLRHIGTRSEPAHPVFASAITIHSRP